MAAGPLHGVRIIDLTNVIMGPFATHILADMGADVIKVESPEGDSFRNYHPHRHAKMSGSFLHLNRNKRSVVLDLKTATGREALDRLIGTADVFLHALRPKAIAKLGYGEQAVRARQPGIIYCGAYGFGADGPYGDKAAYDDLIQAGSGLAALHIPARGEPAYMPTVLCDKLAGQAIAYSILAALFHRERTGVGQAIEVPMFETTVEFAFIEHLGGFGFIPPLGQPGFRRVLDKFRKPYRTADGYACILPYSDRNWQDFFDFTGRSEFKDDPRFSRLAERVQNIEILYAAVEVEAALHSTADWVAFCDRVSIPCMPVLAQADLADDPHLQAVGFFGTAQHPTEGEIRTLRAPVTFSETPSQLRRHAPGLGEHTDEILRELGLAAPLQENAE
jgi:crotonobetainyl-CoA:carnitine CoA-transferase CaiB-like acyl-CoA transferase